MRFVAWIVLVVLLGIPAVSSAGEDALDEVNAVRAARGLRPFVKDDNLTLGAINVADFRAARLIAGHTANDFSGLPAGCSASAGGCAAWEPGLGWGACCTYESWTYAGAGWSLGSDGRRYMHIFVSNTGTPSASPPGQIFTVESGETIRLWQVE